MSMTKGVMVWRGDAGRPNNHYAKSVLESVTDDAALATLITALLTHTLCNCAKRSFNSITGMTDSAPGASANVDRKATIYMRNTSNLHVTSMELPCPVAADCEVIGDGERLKPASGVAIVADIATATGLSLAFLYAPVTQVD
jgi:hypothetical protein